MMMMVSPFFSTSRSCGDCQHEEKNLFFLPLKSMKIEYKLTFDVMTISLLRTGMVSTERDGRHGRDGRYGDDESYDESDDDGES